MITKEVIDSIYKKFANRPTDPEKINLGLLFDYAIDHHAIYVDGGNLVIESIDPKSPFHTIPLRHIHEILEFERSVAIVLHSSIIFLNKKDSGVHIHIKSKKPSLLQRAAYKVFGGGESDFSNL